MAQLFEKTNAREVRHIVHTSARRQSTGRHRRVVQDLLCGPEAIYVVRDERDHEYSLYCECEVQIRLWAADRQSSWSIYRQSSEWEEEQGKSPEGLVLRRVAYDRAKAITLKAWASESLADVAIQMYYLTEQDIPEIATALQHVDRLVRQGVHIEDITPEQIRAQPAPWLTIELSRQFYDFSAQLRWGGSSRCYELEEATFELAQAIDKVLEDYVDRQPEEIEAIKSAWWGAINSETAEMLMELASTSGSSQRKESVQ